MDAKAPLGETVQVNLGTRNAGGGKGGARGGGEVTKGVVAGVGEGGGNLMMRPRG